MINLLFRILGVMLAFVLIVLLIGSLMPRAFTTSSSTVIEAGPEVIFPQLKTIKAWSNWSMWNEQSIRGLEVNYSGPESGVGAIQTWTEPRGEGKLWITECLENELVEFRSVFDNFPEMQSSIKLTAVENGTRVEWKSDGSLPKGPFYGWFGIKFGDSLALEYKKSLERLKRESEIRSAALAEDAKATDADGASTEGEDSGE